MMLAGRSSTAKSIEAYYDALVGVEPAPPDDPYDFDAYDRFFANM